MHRNLWGAAVAALAFCTGGLMTTPKTLAADQRDYPVTPVPFTDVRVDDAFWGPRFDTNRRVTIPYDFRKCEETGRIDNFAKAGRLMPGKFEGIFFNDSDVFKVIEGAALSLALHPDPALDRYLDDLIAKIAAAQEPDGYLYTVRTIDPENVQDACGKTRWSNIIWSHELYNVGHMYEAAVAHYQATGKRSLLDVALKSADLIDKEFGPGRRSDPPGHQEIEMGLAKLYRVTGEERYLRLARFFLDARGHHDGRPNYGEYSQDHVPVLQQDEAVGHSVRATYMYCGMADVAALTGDHSYIAAIDRIWHNVVDKKFYVTGGIGARHAGEAFGDNYELPNDTAYNETCAAIANAMWNHRMFLLHGDAKYIDVLERTVYNGFLSGLALSGDQFFYPNPLAFGGVWKFNHGSAARQEWFGCSCCPTNIVRFIPSLAGYVYARRDADVYVNLFVGGEGRLTVGDTTLTLKQETGYPWQGDVRITVQPDQPARFTLCVRIPGWAQGRPVPSDLYRYVDLAAGQPPVELRVNGTAVKLDIQQGYARLDHQWQPGDVVTLTLPMPIRRVLPHPEIAATRGCVALERGPLVYCIEGVDHGGQVCDLILADDAPLTTEQRPDLFGGVTVLRGKALRLQDPGDPTRDLAPRLVATDFLAIPNYAWAHRGISPMTVWLPRTPAGARVPSLAADATATASHTGERTTPDALRDDVPVASSGDPAAPRFTWYDHRGTTEWVQYDFPTARRVSAVEVYWFDEGPDGQCRVPTSWRLLYKAGDAWQPVSATAPFGTALDGYNVVPFAPVETTALRLEADLQPDRSAGLLEWRVR
jgi:DUF1680 family protein